MLWGVYRGKKLLNITPWCKNARLPIILLMLDDWLGKKEPWSSVGKMGVKSIHGWKGKKLLGMLLHFWQFWVTKMDYNEKVHFSRLPFFLLSLEAKFPWISPFDWRVQYRTMRNSFTDEKQRVLLCLPAVDYQSSCIWSLHAIKWL